jgi:hypothetical protein
MIMADVLTWFLIIVGVLLVLGAQWLAAYALFPALVERSRDRYGRRPVAATMLGLAILLPLLVVGAVVVHVAGHPVVGMLVIGLWMIPALLALLGSAGLALRIGSGLGTSRDPDQPWRVVLRGGVVLSLTFLTPILGWFVLLPWTLVSGLGAAVMALSGGTPAAPMPVAVGDTTGNASPLGGLPS